MQWRMRFPWAEWIQRLCDRWRGRAARTSQPPVTTSPSSSLVGQTAPSPVVSLSSDEPPWDWCWLFGNEMPVCNGTADTPAPTAKNSADVDAGEPNKTNQVAAQTEAIDAVFADYASSNETASGDEDSSNIARPGELNDFLSPPTVGGR